MLKKQKITVNCIIKNEENWIWYALMSVTDYVDKIFVFDTGSTDKTAEIIKTIKNPKIIFEEKGDVDPEAYVDLCQEMINRTKGGWILALGGDEIWTEEAIQELREKIENVDENILMAAIRYWNCLGDVFHYDNELENKKCPIGPKNLTGWWTIHAFRKDIPDLHVTGLYGFEGYADKSGKQIHELGDDKILFLKNRFWHTTHLKRSSKDYLVMQRKNKRRFKTGKPFDKNTIFPKVFYLQRPKIVSPPFLGLTFKDRLKGFYLNPRLKIKTALWQKLVYPRIKKAIEEKKSDEKLAKIAGIK